MKPYSLDYSAGSADPSGGIVWSGEKIDCLGICPGQTLNKVVFLMATKVCELSSPYDLSNLTLQCALDIFNKEETGNRTIASVLQLLADNECSLKELIDGIQSQVDGLSEDTLILDLKCLAEKDSFGNLLPYDNKSVLQGLINEVCNLIEITDGFGGELIDLQNQIDDIYKRLPTGDEKIITTCVSASQTVSQSVIDVAEDYCNFKNSLGSVLEVQQAVSKQCDGLSDDLNTIRGWVINPANLAQSFNNLWIAYCNLLTRVSTIESTCCNVTCRDVTVGMEIISSADGKGISFRFSSAAGTYIPQGFVDKGSNVTFTDSNGAILTYSIVVSQDGTTSEVSLIGLDPNNTINISVSAVLGSDSLTCEKCLSATYSPTSGCPVCAVFSNGKTGSVTIIYEIPTVL